MGRIFRQVRIDRDTQRDRVDQREMALYDLGESRLIAVFAITLKEFVIVPRLHASIVTRSPKNWT